MWKSLFLAVSAFESEIEHAIQHLSRGRSSVNANESQCGSPQSAYRHTHTGTRQIERRYNPKEIDFPLEMFTASMLATTIFVKNKIRSTQMLCVTVWFWSIDRMPDTKLKRKCLFYWWIKWIMYAQWPGSACVCTTCAVCLGECGAYKLQER